MTINEMARQIHDLSKGQVNGEKFTLKELTDVFRIWLKSSDCYIGEITLPDGNWLFEIEQHSKRIDGYSYWIPENRKQEQRLYEALGIK